MYTDHMFRDEEVKKLLGSWTGSSLVSGLSDLTWKAFQAINRRLPEGELPRPKWAPGKMLKSYERSAPPLGFPRVTDSLCPRCVPEVRTAIINGDADLSLLADKHPGEIKAQIVEENGRVLMRKACEKHGPFEDVLSTNPDFTRRIEGLFFGRDFRCAEDEHVHRHGSSTIKFGRGAVLTVDVTNRCNMMCNPCFMDANQVGYVHEPEWEDIKAILDRAVSFKPRRQVIVLFSGGEPTLSPHFLEAVAYAKKIGFYRVLAATNGIRFAQSEDFTRQAHEAGLHGAYLQFDGVTNEKNQHRGVGNLFDVKLQAIENMAKAGMKTTLVTTIVNGTNNDGIGPIVDFAVRNIDKIQTIAFQPVSFTGRDEEIDNETRYAQRYTLSQMVEDLKSQLNADWEPMRDWFPLSSYSAFTSVMDLLQGADAPWGWSACNCHPNCGIFTLLVVNRRTREWTPLFKFFDYEQFIRDVAVITDTARGKTLTAAQLALSILRNFKASAAPKGFPISQIVSLFKPSAARSDSDRNDRMKTRSDQDDWRVLCVEGMWFQDLWTYDFRRTEMCVIPYGTQEGEISFCAYNTGVGWRQIIENMHQTASLAEWHKTNGRHEIFAKGKKVELKTTEHHLILPVLDNAPGGAGCCSENPGLLPKDREVLAR
ncbi:MAG: radical SAM protein [Acidobacteria bacterium]|nr:MAG: radical SAM protein [Acidobacteriota bacterium]PYU99677.1 MAG: radical SAM protein [Acidobacteriota bacterium]